MTPSIVSGAAGAALELTPTLYGELRRIARRHIGGQAASHTLQPTALVHEAYLKLARGRSFADGTHLLATASRAMRQILVDYARAKLTSKRSGDYAFVPDDALKMEDLLALDAAIAALASENARVARAIELCYFGGMTAEEAAVELQVSVHMARHDLRFGQAWLRRRLRNAN